MKISIIVPVYNVESVLHYCVDSILKQTYKDFELILVNDGSTDNSGEICDKYSAKNDNVVVIHTENGGVSKARNSGIDYSKGEYICFVDSDDYVSESYLEELINTKNCFPDCDNVWCGFQTVADYNGADTNLNLASESEDVSIFDRSQIMTLHDKWLSQMPWNKLFVSEIIKKNAIRFPEDLSLGEDMLFVLDYINSTNGKISVINKPLNFYLLTEKESLDNKYYSDLFAIYKRINSELYKYIKAWNCDDSQLTLYYNSCFYSYERVLRNTFHKKSDIKNKYKYNKQIMKSDEFQEALSKCNCYIHPLNKFGYSHNLYRVVRLLDNLFKLKK